MCTQAEHVDKGVLPSERVPVPLIHTADTALLCYCTEAS